MAQYYMQLDECYDAVFERMEGGPGTLTDAFKIIGELGRASGQRGGEKSSPKPKYPLPAGGFDRKRRELDRSLAETRSAVEHDAELSKFLDDRLKAVLSSVPRIVAKRLPHLDCKGLDGETWRSS